MVVEKINLPFIISLLSTNSHMTGPAHILLDIHTTENIEIATRSDVGADGGCWCLILLVAVYSGAVLDNRIWRRNDLNKSKIFLLVYWHWKWHWSYAVVFVYHKLGSCMSEKRRNWYTKSGGGLPKESYQMNKYTSVLPCQGCQNSKITLEGISFIRLVL